jgi:hypothetical protein
MKYLRYYENTNDNNFDIDFAIVKIKEEFSEERISDYFDNEILNWLDDNWEEDGFESENDWYKEHNNGEAQDVIIEDMINWYKKTFNTEIKESDFSELTKAIKDNYSFLN